MPRQLTFDLPVRSAQGREDFFVAPANMRALNMLDAPQVWPMGKCLLIGPAGSGKSHLASVWSHSNDAVIIPASALASLDASKPMTFSALVLEDVHTVAGNLTQETALLHLHNFALAGGTRLLLTARQSPSQWGLTLPDLKSRMEATAICELDAPDDRLLAAVLIKLFADRQVAVPPNLIPYLVSRIDRSFVAARTLVATLDARALAQGRAINRALAAEVLDLGDPAAQ